MTALGSSAVPQIIRPDNHQMATVTLADPISATIFGFPVASFNDGQGSKPLAGQVD
jgi:hypothetical protein